ncbi:MAG: hypothetical protein AB7T38_06815 [Nitrospirales bacterium]
MFLLSYPVAGEAGEGQVVILGEDEFVYHATWEMDGCRVSLERQKKESHLLHFRHDCLQALEKKLALLVHMLEKLVPDLEDRRTIRTLFVGRIVQTFPEFAQRLARAASGDPNWDGKRPWREPGYSNRFVFQLMKEGNLFPELTAKLEPLGYAVEVASVEKILMAKPKDIPFGDMLLEQGANPKTKLPFDALTWFHLKPISNIPPSSHDKYQESSGGACKSTFGNLFVIKRSSMVSQ